MTYLTETKLSCTFDTGSYPQLTSSLWKTSAAKVWTALLVLAAEWNRCDFTAVNHCSSVCITRAWYLVPLELSVLICSFAQQI